jgi:hypothetical protein
MTNDEKRRRLSEAGFEYVKKIHNISRFVHDVRDVIYREIGYF